MKDPTELISRSLQPVLWLAIFGSAFGRMRIVPTAGVSYLAFLAPGVVAQAIAFVSIFNGLAIIWEKDMGLVQKLLTTPLSRSAIILGKMLASSVRALSQLVVVIAFTALLGVHLVWSGWRMAGLLLLTVLGSATFSGLSMVIASLVRTRERMMGIGQLTTMPLFFASSALYPIEIMPPWLQMVAMVNPLTSLVDGLRHLMLDPALYNLLPDVAMLIVSSAIMLALGTKLYPRLLN